MKNYEKMSIAELEAVVNDFDRDITALRDEKRIVARALDRKLVMDEALRKLQTMSDDERAALAQMLNPAGVASQEQVGFIGRLLGKLRAAPGADG